MIANIKVAKENSDGGLSSFNPVVILIEQGKELVCTIREIDPDVEAWRMCKVKVELVG